MPKRIESRDRRYNTILQGTLHLAPCPLLLSDYENIMCYLRTDAECPNGQNEHYKDHHPLYLSAIIQKLSNPMANSVLHWIASWVCMSTSVMDRVIVAGMHTH